MNGPPWKRPVIILNRESGTIANAGPEALAQELRELLEGMGAIPDVRLVAGRDIQATLAAARDSTADVIFVGGGDGTVATAATILAGQDKPLGILPLGTFNLAARDAGIPLDWREAAQVLIRAEDREVDLLDVGGQLYCCVAVLGFYPALALARQEYHGHWLIKALTVTWSALRSMATFPPLHLVLRNDDGTEVRRRTRIALIANNDYEDLFGVIPKRSSMDGGFFTIYVSSHRTQWGMLRAFVNWLIGRWKQDKELTMIQATEVEINVRGRRRIPIMRDGELDKIAVPFRITLRPKALRLLVPPVELESL